MVQEVHTDKYTADTYKLLTTLFYILLKSFKKCQELQQ